MKIDKPTFTILTDNMSLDDKLRVDLNTACFKFTKSKKEDTIIASKQLAIDMRIAMNQYLTGAKIQQFANNAAEHDTIGLTKELNDFINEFNKLSK